MDENETFTEEELDKACDWTYSHFESLLGKDMVQVMMASKKIEVQLISVPQKESILNACKELAAGYKSTKNILIKARQEPISTDNLHNFLNKFDKGASELVTTVQNTSISSYSFQDFVPTIQMLKRDIQAVRSFALGSNDQKMQQYKLLQRTVHLVKERKSAKNDESPKKGASSSQDFGPRPNFDTNRDRSMTVGGSQAKDVDTFELSVDSPQVQRLDLVHSPLTRKRSKTSADRPKYMTIAHSMSNVVLKQYQSNETRDADPMPIKPLKLKTKNLFEAASSGDVEEAVEHRKKGLGINGVDPEGWSALHWAASKGHLNMCKYLVSEGINLEIKDMQGMTAFDRACMENQQETATYLVQRGASFDMFSRNGMVIMDKSHLPQSFWENLSKKTIEATKSSDHLSEEGKDQVPTHMHAHKHTSDGNFGTKLGKEQALAQKRDVSVLLEKQREELQQHVQQFTFSLALCVNFLSKSVLNRLELNGFNQPLKGLTTQLKNILTVLNGTGVDCGQLHSSVLNLVQQVKNVLGTNSTQTVVSTMRQTLALACKHTLETLTQLNFICNIPVSHDDVFQQVQQYLLSMKQLLNKDASLDSQLVTKSTSLSMIKLLHQVLRFTNQSEHSIPFFAEVLTFCAAIEENTTHIITHSNKDEQITIELTKQVMSKVRELVKFLKSTVDDLPKVVNSQLIQEAIVKVDSILDSPFGKQDSVLMNKITDQIRVHSKEFRKLRRFTEFDPAPFMESCCILASSIESILSALTLPSTVSLEDPLASLSLALIKLLQHISFQLKCVGSGGALEVLLFQKKVETMGNFCLHIKTLAIADSLLFTVVLIQGELIPAKKQIDLSPMIENISLQRQKEREETRVPSAGQFYFTKSSYEDSKTKLIADATMAGLQIQGVLLVKLFERSRDSPWKETTVEGLLTLIANSRAKDHFFQITHPETLEAVFLFRIPQKFEYTVVSPTFHEFPTEHGYAGFLFHSAQEANLFQNVAKQMLRR